MLTIVTATNLITTPLTSNTPKWPNWTKVILYKTFDPSAIDPISFVSMGVFLQFVVSQLSKGNHANEV